MKHITESKSKKNKKSLKVWK